MTGILEDNAQSWKIVLKQEQLAEKLANVKILGQYFSQGHYPTKNYILLRFSSHHGVFTATTFGKDEVLMHANGPIVSSSTVPASLKGVYLFITLQIISQGQRM